MKENMPFQREKNMDNSYWAIFVMVLLISLALASAFVIGGYAPCDWYTFEMNNTLAQKVMGRCWE